MKSLFLTPVLALLISTVAFADDVAGVSNTILYNFRNEFKNASDVAWVTRKDFVKASFVMDDEQMEVFYKANGDWIATSKQIDLDDLPTNAKRVFAKRYQDYTVKEAIYIETPEENAYYISADNDKLSVILKVDQSTQVSLFKRIKNQRD